MKKWIACWITVLLIGVGYGVYAKSAFVNEVDYRNLLETAGDYRVISYYAYGEKEYYFQGLEDKKHSQGEMQVALVQASGDYWSLPNSTTATRLHVLEVCQGDEMLEGKDIIFSADFKAIAKDFVEEKYIGNSKVNFMRAGDEYLVLMRPMNLPEGMVSDELYFKEYDDSLSWFNLKDIPNRVPENVIHDENSSIGLFHYCYYRDIADNEVFALEQRDIDDFLHLKEEVLERYLPDKS